MYLILQSGVAISEPADLRSTIDWYMTLQWAGRSGLSIVDGKGRALSEKFVAHECLRARERNQLRT